MNLPFLGALLIAMGLKAVSWRDALQALAMVPFNAAIQTWLLPTKTLQPSLACGGAAVIEIIATLRSLRLQSSVAGLEEPVRKSLLPLSA